MLKRLKKNFEKDKHFIYLAGPFFNQHQLSKAKDLAKCLRERGYRIYAPVDGTLVQANLPESAPEIFERNIQWMNDSLLILAQLDYPLIAPKVLSVVDTDTWNHVPVNLPDAGTVFEMGYMYANEIPIIGYTDSPLLAVNLMLTEALTGYIDEEPLDVFLKGGIMWSLIIEWKGKKI